MTQQNVRLSEDKPVLDVSTARKASKGRSLFEYSISEEEFTFSTGDLPLLQDGKASLQRDLDCPALQSKPAGNSPCLTAENVRKLRTPAESPVDTLINRYFSSILETSPTKTDVQALIAVPACSPVISSGTSDPPAGISGVSADQPEPCLPGIDSLAPEKQDSPKGQTSHQRKERAGKSAITVCDQVEGSGNDKSAADFLGTQKLAGVNQDGKSYHSHSNRGGKRRRLLPIDVAFFCTPNFPESPEDPHYPDLKKQRQTGTSVKSESVTPHHPLTEILRFNIRRQITNKNVSDTKAPAGHGVKIAQRHRSQKSPKRLSTSTEENAVGLAYLNQEAREKETLLMTEDHGKGKQGCEGLPSSLGSPPPSKSSPSKKSNQVPLISRDLWSSTTCNSFLGPSNTDSKQAPAEVAGDMWESHSQSMRFRDVEQHSLHGAGAKDVVQTAHPNNTSDQDVRAAKDPCNNGQCVDQDLRTDSYSSSELSQPSVAPPKQTSLWVRSAGSTVLGSKAHFQEPQKPGKSPVSVTEKTRLHGSGLQNKLLPLQKENLGSRPKAVSCQAPQMHNKEVPKESKVSLKAATPHRQSHSSGQGACGNEMKPSRTSPSKAGSLAMKDAAHVCHETQGTVHYNNLPSRKEPLVSEVLLAKDCPPKAVRPWKNFWQTSRNVLKSTECDGQRKVVKTAKEQLAVASAAKERLSDKTFEENYGNIGKSQKKARGQQCFSLEEKSDVPKASSVTGHFREPVMPRKIFWRCLANFSTSTQHCESEVKGMRVVEDEQLPVVCATKEKFNDKRHDGGSEVELYQKKEQCTRHTANFTKVTCPRPTVSKQLELFQDGLKCGTKDASVQTSFVCMIGSGTKMDREARHQLLSSLYIGEEEVQFMDPYLKPAGESAPFSFGTYIASTSASVGIMKLRPDCEKPMAVDNLHDILFYALDDGVLITTFSDAWTLLEKGSVFRLIRGMPYMLKNVGMATSKLFYVLTTPG